MSNTDADRYANGYTDRDPDGNPNRIADTGLFIFAESAKPDVRRGRWQWNGKCNPKPAGVCLERSGRDRAFVHYRPAGLRSNW